MYRVATTSDDVDALLEATHKHRAVVVTGPHGIGKSHALRSIATAAADQGLSPVSVLGSPAARAVPLACFAGTIVEPEQPLTSSAIITSLTRRRSRTLLVVDAVDLLDDSSLMVVGHLVRTAGMTAILAARSLDDCPPEIRALYDAGQLTEVPLQPVRDTTLINALREWLEGPLTPGTQRDILQAAAGNPLVARELVSGSLATGALRETDHGWELDGPVAATPQLSRVLGAHVESLNDDVVDALALVALAGSLPESTLSPTTQRPLTRSGLVIRDADGWFHANQPLLAATVRAQMPDNHWQVLAQQACNLLDDVARADPARRAELTRRATAIALNHDLPLSASRAASLATYALASGDYPLALRAADAALTTAETASGEQSDDIEPLRVRGLATSAMGMRESAVESLDRARAIAKADADVAAVAVARANHLGLAELDPHGALEVIAQAKAMIDDEEWMGHLDRAAFRWAALTGHSNVTAHAPGEVTEAEAAMGMAVMATSAVVTGPLEQAFALEARFRSLPTDVVSQAPGAAALMQLASIMALSYTGDIQATRRSLNAQIELARRHAPEMCGAWEYALGVVELFAADAGTAYTCASDAVDHLRWRDPFGLEPAATALRTAAGAGAGVELEAAPAAIAHAASELPDPKVAVLASWTSAWSAAAERRTAQAAEILVAGAEAMMAAQHTFFAAKLAHCAVRAGTVNPRTVAVLEQAEAVGGGGLLSLMAEHAHASSEGNAAQLHSLAQDMVEMGLVATATDTWLSLAHNAKRLGASELDARRWLTHASAVRAEHPGMALWQLGTANAGLLTRREYEVAVLVAQRLTAKEIARARGVSPHTVNNQIQSVYTKLGVSGRAQLREVLEGFTPASAALSPIQ